MGRTDDSGGKTCNKREVHPFIGKPEWGPPGSRGDLDPAWLTITKRVSPLGRVL